MNPNTGDIKEFKDAFQATVEGYTVPVPPKELPALASGNREQRRKWAQEQQRKARQAERRMLREVVPRG